jgi:hypothetical protein
MLLRLVGRQAEDRERYPELKGSSSSGQETRATGDSDEPERELPFYLFRVSMCA